MYIYTTGQHFILHKGRDYESSVKLSILLFKFIDESGRILIVLIKGLEMLEAIVQGVIYYMAQFEINICRIMCKQKAYEYETTRKRQRSKDFF